MGGDGVASLGVLRAGVGADRVLAIGTRTIHRGRRGAQRWGQRLVEMMVRVVVIVGSHDEMGLREPHSAQLAYDQALDLNLDPPQMST